MSPCPTPPCVCCGAAASILAMDDHRPRCGNCASVHERAAGYQVEHCCGNEHEELKSDAVRLAAECVFIGALEVGGGQLLHFNHWCKGTFCIEARS